MIIRIEELRLHITMTRLRFLNETKLFGCGCDQLTNLNHDDEAPLPQ